jgi:hypothetical protein
MSIPTIHPAAAVKVIKAIRTLRLTAFLQV